MASTRPVAQDLRNLNDGMSRRLTVAGGHTIWEGTLAGINGFGHAIAAHPNYPVVGMAIKNTAQGNEVTLFFNNVVSLTMAGAAETDIGRIVYAVDNDTCSTASNNAPLGPIVQILSTNKVLVWLNLIDPAQADIDTTDDLPEGTTNLYYTETRVNANANVAANTAARHTHSNKVILDGISITTVNQLSAAYGHSQTTGNPHGTTLDDVGGTLDHDQLNNTGAYTHGDIDNHIDDGTIHFTESSISHLNIGDIGTNSHSAIDNHIGNTSNPHSVTIGQVSPLAAKGDLLTHNGSTNQVLNAGTNTYILTANSGVAKGIEWTSRWPEYYTSDTVTQASTNAGTYQTYVTFTFTPVAGTYRLGWYWELGGSANGIRSNSRIYDNTSALTYGVGLATAVVSTSGEFISVSGYKIITLTAVSTTLLIQYYKISGAGSTYIQNGRIFLGRIA